MVVCGDDEAVGTSHHQDMVMESTTTECPSISSLKGLPTTSPPPQEDLSSCEEDPVLSYYVPLNPQLDLYGAIVEAVALEPKYQPALSLPTVAKDSYEITARMRNGSCHVLRCLKVWYELPSDAFFLAVNTMDRFLTRMRAQPKHLSCIAVAAFSVAAQEVSPMVGKGSPSRESISVISQSKCTSNDVQRMEDIIRNKLDLSQHLPITALSMLKLLHAAHHQLVKHHFNSSPCYLPPLLPLIYKLEMILCDTRAASCRPSQLVLALLRTQLLTTDPINAALHNYCLQPLFSVCKSSVDSIEPVEEIVQSVLREYDTPKHGGRLGKKVYYKQRLVWKLSNRTLRQLKPTSKLRKHHRLPTISETSLDIAPGAARRGKALIFTPDNSLHLLANLPPDNSGPPQQDTENEENTSGEEEKIEKMETSEDEREENVDDAHQENDGIEKMDSEESNEETSSSSCDDKDGRKSAAEESYSQVAKKMREENKKEKDFDKKISSFASSFSTITNCIQKSPLSKITLTPTLSSSPTVQTLPKGFAPPDKVSEYESYYGYHHARHVGVLEGIDGDITAAQLAQQKLSNGKRKKKRIKLGLFTQIRFDSCDSVNCESCTNASSSSEEEMDFDYEKAFPPLPVPRTSPLRLPERRAKKVSLPALPPSPTHGKKKKKKKTDSSVAPYPTKCRAKQRKMKQARKIAAVAVQQK